MALLLWYVWCGFLGIGLSLLGFNVVETPVQFLLLDICAIGASWQVFKHITAPKDEHETD